MAVGQDQVVAAAQAFQVQRLEVLHSLAMRAGQEILVQARLAVVAVVLVALVELFHLVQVQVALAVLVFHLRLPDLR
jgi:hypothetical protein